MPKRAAMLVTILVVCLALPACKPASQRGGKIEGRWTPVSLANGKAVPGTFIEFRDDATTNGFSGCNTFTGGYTTTTKGSLSIGPLASTRIACPPAAMVGEAEFLNVLDATRSYAASDTALTFYDDNGVVLARLEPTKARALTGVIWVLRAYNNGKGAVVSTPSTGNITARFDDTGHVRGRSGCGKYDATYSTHGQEITITPPRSAETSPCTSEQRAERSAYFAALGSAASWQTGAAPSAGGAVDLLELRTDTGALAATFEAERAETQ